MGSADGLSRRVALDENTLGRLRELQFECAAQISGDASRGSGFFIDDRLLLTCEHVSGPVGTELQVIPYGRPPRPGKVIDTRAGRATDLALVETTPPAGEARQPAVTLDRGIELEGAYVAVGYPREDYVGEEGIEAVSFFGHARRAPDGSSTELLKINPDARIGTGLSGAAVLSRQSGAVIAVVQYSEDPRSAAGGGAIPIARAAELFPQVRALLAESPLATQRWRDTLGRESWKRLGRRWDQRRRVDLRITGDQHCWQVDLASGFESDGEPPSLSARNLPDEVAGALFRWAMRRRIRKRDEVLFLGELLSKAIFPPHIQEQLTSALRADDVLIRLWVPADSDLFEVPWEFATIELEARARHVAAAEGLALVRVAEHPEPKLVQTAPGAGVASVLGILVQPEKLQRFLPAEHRTGSARTEWPTRKEVANALRLATAVEHLELTALDDPTLAVLRQKLDSPSAPIEIVHYIGFGRMLDGSPALALHDDNGGLDWCGADEIFGPVAASGARLLVVELGLPPTNEEFEDIPASAFVGALRGRVNAVVFTRFPVYPGQWRSFNTAFYAALAAGEAVETAVQRARHNVSSLASAFGDAAGFGWFTVITGERQNMQIVSGTPVAPGPGVSGGTASMRPEPRAGFLPASTGRDEAG